jgi:hypothetical protein
MSHSRFGAIAVCFAFASCTAEASSPLDLPEIEPSLAVAGDSGCYTVVGTISETGFFPNFSGVISGDLVGTTVTTIGFGGASGAVIKNPGVRSIEVTGGTVGALVGQTIEESLNGLSIDDGAELVRINERTRIESGAARGNLTTHGSLNLSTTPWEVEVTYRGVICL